MLIRFMIQVSENCDILSLPLPVFLHVLFSISVLGTFHWYTDGNKAETSFLKYAVVSPLHLDIQYI